MGVRVGLEQKRATRARALEEQVVRERELGAFAVASLACAGEEDTNAVIARATALLTHVFSLEHVAVVLHGASGDVVRGEGLASFALTAPMRRALARSTVAHVGPPRDLPWAQAPGSQATSGRAPAPIVGWVPLQGEREVRGFVFWSGRPQRSFRPASPSSPLPTPDDRPFLALFASHVAHALRNVRHTEELRARADELARANLQLRQSLAEAERAQQELATERRSPTVLVVEDEDAILTIARRVLETSGFRVLSASSGAEALALARREGTVDLLLTDVAMPHVSGVELAETLRRESRTRGVLFMSGYSFDGPGERFLPKPFTPHQLVARVSECVASDAPLAVAH